MSAIGRSHAVLGELTKLSKTSTLSINELRIILALERIVARLDSHRGLRDKLIFKGGFVLLKALASQRFTRDLDALADRIPKGKVVPLVQRALRVDLEDGFYFAEPAIEDLLDQGAYGGFRIKVPFRIGAPIQNLRELKKLSRVHLDIGFGDVIAGRAKRAELTPLIKGDVPVSWKVYPIESIFAEKLETLVRRGSANSRAKDVYDLVIIFESIGKSASLASSLKKTFRNRSTPLPESLSEFLKGLDLTILRNSWGSVDLQGGKMTFVECERKLRKVFREVDGVLG